MDTRPSAQAHLPRFDLDIVVAAEAHRLQVSGTAILPEDPTPRVRLDFLLRTDVSGLRLEVLDPPGARGPVEVRAVGRVPNMAATQKFEGGLPAPCPPGTPLVLSVEYECGSEENRRWLHITPDFSFSSWYASAWLPMFGFRRGTGTFRYSVPNGMVVAATGHLSGVDPQGDGVVYTFIADTPSVFDFVAGPFTVQRREGPVPVSVYHLQPLVAAEEIVARAARIIAILEDEFGPYPFDELAIVEAPMGPAVYAGLEGGAYPGYFLVRSDLLRADGLEDWVVGHELTHFWFPHVVGHIDEAVAPAMLDEALAHYGALRVVEALSGPAAAEQFRRDGAKEAIRLTAAGLEHSLAGKTTTERWDRVAYNFSNTKGHLVYDMLARVVGRKRFQSALQAVIREHAGRDIAWTDFWQSIEAGAGQSIDWFSAQWLDSPFLPTLSVEWSQVDSDLKLEVRQSAPAFRLDVPFQVEFSDGTALLRTARVESETVPIEMETDKVVHAVRLDPHFTILHATPDQWAEAEARRFVTKGALLREDEDFDRALDMLRMGLEQVDEIDRSGVEFLLRLQIGWVHQDQGRLDEALTEYERALACAVRPADYLARLYLNLATIAADRGDHERVLWAAKNALAAERSLGKETEIGRQARQLRESDE